MQRRGSDGGAEFFAQSGFGLHLSGNGAGNDNLNINTAGNVGIGTTSPQAPLHVGSGGGPWTAANPIVAFHAATNDNLLVTAHSALSNGPRLFAINDAANTAEPMELWASAYDFSLGNV